MSRMCKEAKAMEQFLGRINKCLCCRGKTKQQLIDGMKAEILERYPEPEQIAYSDLVKEFGDPADIAAELQEGLDPEEAAFVRKRKRVILTVSTIAAVLVIAVLGYYVLSTIQREQVHVIEKIILYK